jgi:hypothetical protein
MAGAETWHRILDAIERRQAEAPTEGGEGALVNVAVFSGQERRGFRSRRTY